MMEKRVFAAALNIYKKKTKRQPPAASGLGTPRSVPLTAIDHARQATEDYLAHFPPHRCGGILRGALVSFFSQTREGRMRPRGWGGEK